jgi:hypothetical protein
MAEELKCANNIGVGLCYHVTSIRKKRLKSVFGTRYGCLSTISSRPCRSRSLVHWPQGMAYGTAKYIRERIIGHTSVIDYL